jgi:hypothetical protein
LSLGGTLYRRHDGNKSKTYGFLVLFCMDAPSLYALCAFDSPRLEQLFIVRCLLRTHATGFGFLLSLLGRRHLNCVRMRGFLKVTVIFSRALGGLGNQRGGG